MPAGIKRQGVFMRKLILFLTLTVIAAGSIFAQQKQSYIKPTFSAGFSTGKEEGHSETLTTLALDVDFVSPIGLTFGTQTAQAWNDDVPATPFIAFGLGYTYTAGKWSAGGKLLAVPFGDGGLGIDGNGTWWFNEYLGVTGILDLYFSMSEIDWNLFSLRVGISGKF
jgi:hypothetical protein